MFHDSSHTPRLEMSTCLLCITPNAFNYKQTTDIVTACRRGPKQLVSEVSILCIRKNLTAVHLIKHTLRRVLVLSGAESDDHIIFLSGVCVCMLSCVCAPRFILL